MKISVVEPWQEFVVGPYRVQSMHATHGGGKIEAMLYAIADASGSQLFCGTDMAALADGTWERMAELGWSFDTFVLDHTGGVQTGKNGSHHNEETFRAEIARARAARVITDRTRILATHFAHHRNPTHDKLADWTSLSGYEPAYDGLTLTVGG